MKIGRPLGPRNSPPPARDTAGAARASGPRPRESSPAIGATPAAPALAPPLPVLPAVAGAGSARPGRQADAGRAAPRAAPPARRPPALPPGGPAEARTAAGAAGWAPGRSEGASGPPGALAGHLAAGVAVAVAAPPAGGPVPLVSIPQQQLPGNCPAAPPERGGPGAPDRERPPRNPALAAALAEDPQLGRANYHKRHGMALARKLNAAGLGKAAARVEWCSNTLCLDERGRIMHREACHVRVCPMCQSFRASRWATELRGGLLSMLASEERPLDFAHLTLTVRNYAAGELRERTRAIHKGLDRMTKRAVFPALGYVRNTEVTVNLKDGTVHPHVHMLLVLPASYYAAPWHYEPSTRKGGRRRIVPGYMTHAEYVELWQEAARLDYAPSVRIQAVKLDTPRGRQSLYEVAKYGVKPASVAGMSPDMLHTFMGQIRGTRAIAVTGLLGRYVREPDEDEAPEVREADAMALWDERARRYVSAPLRENEP